MSSGRSRSGPSRANWTGGCWTTPSTAACTGWCDLNRVYRESPALWALDAEPAGFAWLDADDSARNVYSFVRRGARPGEVGEELVCVANFAAVPHDGYRIGLPSAGAWDEVVNTDAEDYGGSGVGNLGAVTATAGEHAGWPAYADVRVPPLGTLWLRRRPAGGPAQRASDVSVAT